METKFTKGPWVANYGGTEGHIKAIKEGGTPTVAIADVITPSLTDEEKKANAHLIAAAPDMYKEIEQDILWLERLSKDYVIGSYELRSIQLRIKSKRILLAKARGEE